ncbi:Uncharacterised protein [uncultured archaeon]|nr:Uncharacterised protein [uncultured archaeon]
MKEQIQTSKFTLAIYVLAAVGSFLASFAYVWSR